MIKMEDIDLLTNSEIKEMMEELSKTFDKTKIEVVQKMMQLEKLEEKYNELKTLLKKRTGNE